MDVLSFSTAVDIAVANGAAVLPCQWRDDSAAQFASDNGALLASARSTGRYSLSPASLLSIPSGTRLVLPSPNGSVLSLSACGVPVFTACLRNAPSVAKHVAACRPRVTVIAAGERWDDASLRPCLEDWIGAGAVLAELSGTMSSEAEWAVATFNRFKGNLTAAISGCESGQELIERGFGCDVDLAAQYAVSTAVPFLTADGYVNASLSIR